jgi:hypothetical protein
MKHLELANSQSENRDEWLLEAERSWEQRHCLMDRPFQFVVKKFGYG